MTEDNIYKYNDDCCCLVDLDEGPPVGPNEKALSMATRISLMLNLKFFNKMCQSVPPSKKLTDNKQLLSIWHCLSGSVQSCVQSCV